MKFDEFNKYKEKVTGFEDQEILVNMLAASVAECVEISAETLKLHVRQALQDAVDKRNTNFKDMKLATQEEKKRFVSDVVIITIKRAKLVNSVDEIVPRCNKTYNEWKQKYRPNET